MLAQIKYFKNVKYFLKKDRDKSKQYLLFIASKTPLDLDELNEHGINYVGAIFSEIIYNNKLYESGLIVMEVTSNMQLTLIKDIQNVSFLEDEFKDCQSIISIVEGVSEYNESFLENLFSQVDVNTNIVGGGAGFIKNDSGGVIFDCNGFYYNSAILVKIKNNITLGVQHGCQVLKGPFVVTSANKNLLSRIDYKDAFDVYQEVIKEDCGKTLNEENFASIAKNYPLGIVKYNSEQIVRDPIALKDGQLVLVGQVKNDAVLNILKVDKESMLKGSKAAAKEAINEDTSFVVMFDCTSRVGYLEEAFTQELENISSLTHRTTTFGAVTLGEIANSGNRYINFYNKTCVIGALCI